MNFNFTEEEQDILNSLQKYVDEEIAPKAHDIDENEEFPVQARNDLAEQGYFGMYFPEEYGGAGLSYLSYIAAAEKIAEACATTSIVLMAHESLCMWPIFTYGTDAAKQKYLPKLCSGEILGAFALTEPGAGTDAAMQKTTYRAEGDHFVLNGGKCFITNAQFADVFVVFAMKEGLHENHGISGFIVEKDYPGFQVIGHELKMGIRGSSTAQLAFDEVKVPAENLLGQEGKGFKVAMTTLDGGRIGVAAQAVGIAQAAIRETVKYDKERIQFGKPIWKFQNTQFQLAEMQAHVDAARLLVYRAAQYKQDHPDLKTAPDISAYAAMAKLVASEVASDVTRKCVQLCGGFGYSREYPFERHMRDAKITEIYEGTSEVQRMVISGWLGAKY
jgi:butyryl-CoA dehydrogenase